jgi:hypothetical protein
MRKGGDILKCILFFSQFLLKISRPIFSDFSHWLKAQLLLMPLPSSTESLACITKGPAVRTQEERPAAFCTSWRDTPDEPLRDPSSLTHRCPSLLAVMLQET